MTTGTLSQSDIDSLLQGAAPETSAPVATRDEVLLYDFRRPRRIPRERLRVIEGVYTRFAVSVQALLASRLREPVDIGVAGVEQASFAEFVFSLANPCSAFVFDLGGTSGGQAALDIGNDFSLHLVDRLFGGPGEGADLKRTLTSLEQLAVSSIAERMLALFADAWQDHLTFKPTSSAMETVPEALQFAQREEHVLVASFSARAGKVSTTLALCLPLRILEPFLAEASAARSTAAGHRTDGVDCRQQIEGVVRGAQIPVAVRLPLFTLSAREVAALDERRIVMTSHPADEPVEVHVGGRRRFLGLPGRTRQALGVRITETFVGAPEDPARTAPKGRLL